METINAIIWAAVLIIGALVALQYAYERGRQHEKRVINEDLDFAHRTSTRVWLTKADGRKYQVFLVTKTEADMLAGLLSKHDAEVSFKEQG